MTRRRNDRRAGFTLIELIVVITIIGILITTVGVGYMTFIQDASKSKVAADGSEIYKACQLYKARKLGKMPDSMEDLNAVIPLNEGEGVKDPWNNEYEFQVRDGKVYLKSFGADGSAGGSDENEDLEVINGKPQWGKETQ